MVAHRQISTLSTEVMPSLREANLQQKQMLVYNQARDWWEGGVEGRYLWMEHSTFLLYVNAYLEFHKIAHPTKEQMQEAVEHCARLAYWDGCERFYDRRVHVQRSKTEAHQERNPLCPSSLF